MQPGQLATPEKSALVRAERCEVRPGAHVRASSRSMRPLSSGRLAEQTPPPDAPRAEPLAAPRGTSSHPEVFVSTLVMNIAAVSLGQKGKKEKCKAKKDKSKCMCEPKRK